MKTMCKTLIISLVLAGLAPVARSAETNKATAFDFKFPGGTAAQFIAAIDQQSGQKVNLLCPPQLSVTQIPSMDFRSVTADNIFEAFRAVSFENERLNFIRIGNIWSLQSDKRIKLNYSRVYYVGHLLQKFKIQDITTAIQTSWKLSNSKVDADLKYHEDTQLLIVLADKDQHDMVTNVLEQLHLALDATPAKTDAAINTAAKPKP